MTTEGAESKNVAIRRQALVDLKVLMTEMLEVDADQVMWNHVANVASCANAFADELNGTETEDA